MRGTEDEFNHEESGLWVRKNGSNFYIFQERHHNEAMVKLTEEVAKKMAEWILKKEQESCKRK